MRPGERRAWVASYDPESGGGWESANPRRDLGGGGVWGGGYDVISGISRISSRYALVVSRVVGEVRAPKRFNLDERELLAVGTEDRWNFRYLQCPIPGNTVEDPL